MTNGRPDRCGSKSSGSVSKLAKDEKLGVKVSFPEEFADFICGS